MIALGSLFAGCLVSALAERRLTARALARERRRVAADIHDLIMQDLSLSLANARTLADDPAGPPRASLVVGAGERALAGARAVVGDLNGQSGPEARRRQEKNREPIVAAIAASVQAAARSTPVIFDADGVPESARPDEPTRAALVHIAREAVTNATKHTGTNTIEVGLEYTGSWRLTVRDEGEGFDAERANNGFGLGSMRAHVQALGGVLHVNSAAQEGTTVEVFLP